MARPDVAEDLAVVDLQDPCRLLYTFLSAGDRLDAYVGDGPLNTDDRPVLSYSTYGAGYRQTIAENLLDLLACRTDVARYVRDVPPGAALLRHHAASNDELLGHVFYHLGHQQAALAHYRGASRLLPDDRALQELAQWPYAAPAQPTH
jgi:hypothetical protein